MNIQKLKISRRVGLIDLFKEKGFKVGVEIGTDHGGYAKDIVSRSDIKLYTIDPFIAYTEGNEVKTQEDVDLIYKEAQETLAPYPNATIMKMESLDAAKYFRQESLDFVFVDGDHRFIPVLQDIFEWYPKVKKGGIIAGHDYKKDDERGYGVIQAVAKAVEAIKPDTLYILEKGTYVPCWMFYK